MVVAEKLSMTLHELQTKMTFEELQLWMLFYELRKEEEDKAMRKAQSGRR